MSDFRNRLTKVYKHISKWAKRNGITCYRIYDWDIPGHPLVIDAYGEYIHISEYKTRHQLNDDEYDAWWNTCLQDCSEVLSVPVKNIFVKRRERHDHKQTQYEKFSENSFITWQKESNLEFKINLTDYLDTGLFLDHRPMRKMVFEESKDKRVLNLFSYTGSFSVYAAAGGASKVTTVDLSNTYINWAKENFKRNNIPLNNHEFNVQDTMEFLKENKQTFDLVVTDPPSFSNSKKMKGTWDTQRDHRKMLHLIYQKLAPGGVVYFSNNFRSFIPDIEGLGYKTVQEITQKTIPEDYRNKKIHKSYLLKK